MFVGEKALSAWCKVIDACGDVFVTAFRDDCLEYISTQNDNYQRQLEDQTFVELFLGGIFKLDLLNAAYQRGNSPSPKPRLNGVFLGYSQVPPAILECITADLIKLTRDPEARSEFPILNMVPNMTPRISKLSASSPTTSGGRSSRQGKHSRSPSRRAARCCKARSCNSVAACARRCHRLSAPALRKQRSEVEMYEDRRASARSRRRARRAFWPL